MWNAGAESRIGAGCPEAALSPALLRKMTGMSIRLASRATSVDKSSGRGPDVYSVTPVRDALLRSALAMLTQLTVFSARVVTLMILVPVRPSRENVISMPTARRNVCARRSRPASARGFLAYAPPIEMSLRALSPHTNAET